MDNITTKNISKTSPFFTERIRGVEIKFKTKPAVFSRQGLDSGTRLLAENMEVEDGVMVADLGCGTGVLGFVAAKLNPNGHVHLLDVNLRTIELAKENVELNKLNNVEIFLSDLFSAVSDRSYHLILSNPAQHFGNQFLDECTKECVDHLKSAGCVYWIVQKHVQPVIERLFDKYFGNCTIVARSNAHVVLKAQKNGKT